MFSYGSDWIAGDVAIGVIYFDSLERAVCSEDKRAYKTYTQIARGPVHTEVVSVEVYQGLSRTDIEAGSEVVYVREAERIALGIGGSSRDEVMDEHIVNALSHGVGNHGLGGAL